VGCDVVVQAYEPVFIDEVKYRHASARVFFRQLPAILSQMPLTCDPDPAALDALLTIHKSVRQSRLTPRPCMSAPWPVKVHHHPRRPANLWPSSPTSSGLAKRLRFFAKRF